jgi:hypothetical protein
MPTFPGAVETVCRDDPATHAFPIVPDDVALLPQPVRGIHCGQGGTIVLDRIAIAQGFQGHCRHPARRAHRQPADALRNEPVEPRWCGLYRSKWACRQESDKKLRSPALDWATDACNNL